MILPSLVIERSLWHRGLRLVAGIDEVGRGALAGPIVAAAVILPSCRDTMCRHLSDVRDSKLLTAKKREELSPIIKAQAVAFSLGIVDAGIIDQIGIGRANLLAMREAIDSLKPLADFFLIDCFQIPQIPREMQLPIIRGDQKSVSIAAASIVAKVYRDNLMVELGKEYPQYFWERNKGYGTLLHREAIKKYGLSPLHRVTFTNHGL